MAIWNLSFLYCSILLELFVASTKSQLSPSVCSKGEHVVLGSTFSLTGSNETSPQISENCSFWDWRPADPSEIGDSWIRQGSNYVFNATGTYGYNCHISGDTGNLTVVPARYTIPLCKACRSSGEYNLRKGESLQWVLLPEDLESPPLTCTVAINSSSGGSNPILVNDVSEFIFQETGTFVLYCLEDQGFNASIVVQGAQPTSAKYLPLVYTHVALMMASLGVLFPIAVFLYYLKLKLAYLILYSISWILCLCGFVVIIVYIQLTDRHYFQHVIHAALSYPLTFVFLVSLPLLLVHNKLVPFHRRLGHVTMALGITNVITGLPILPAPFVAGIAVCVIYGLWLLFAELIYVTYSPKKKTDKESVSAINCSLEMKEKTRPNGTLSHNPSSASLQSRGPQPLSKNMISETKMIQLRKKSMDFLEAQRQMRHINEELGVKHQLARELEMEEDESNKDRMDKKSKSTSPERDSPDGYNLDNSRVPLNPSSPDMEDPFSPPSQSRHQHRSYSSDEEDDERERTTPGIMRANTFNYTSRRPHHMLDDQYPESDTSEKGGSVRITRHSKRARVKLENMFQNTSTVVPEAPAAPTPVFSITPSTPLITSPVTSESELQDKFDTVTKPEPAPSPPVLAQPNIGSAVAGRRRKAAMVPPVLAELNQPDSVEGAGPTPHGACPFPSSLKTPSPRPCRRGISPRAPSPTGSSGGETDQSAPPKRKKKVSVAQIEATVVPPTPVTLMPPDKPLSRASSFETLRTHQDAFADNAFRSIMQISQNAIVCANSIGDIVFWSAGACKMFGYTPGEAAGSSLEMIIPTSYKEKHRNGITRRTENTMKYIRKHSYAPEEQKHARLYEVRGVTKGGHEIPVEVNVTSFVLDGEMFYTGVISEMAKAKDSKRSSVSSSMSDLNEVALQQRALAVGAQMKMAHKLRSAEQISRRELERVLKGSIGTSFEVDPAELEVMIAGIMKAGDPEGTGAMTFVSLIQLLSKNQLYISESGLIARYGKTKGAEVHTRNLSFSDKLQDFLSSQAIFLVWLLVYLGLNLVVFAAGVGAYSQNRSIRDTWKMWAYGTGPVLSMNTVLILLPTLMGLINAMRGVPWMHIIFPLTRPVAYHIIIAGGIVFWTLIHLLTHFTSFAMDSPDNSFHAGIKENISPMVTGVLILIIFVMIGISSIKPLRSLVRYIPFRLIHWIGGFLFYFLLLIHGVSHWNPSYWKWLLPALIVFIVERVYRHVIIKKTKVNVKCAGRYDSVSRTAIVELENNSKVDYEPGQYILLNLPKIGKFEWQTCYISSGPKDDKLTIHIPFSNDLWFKKTFEYLKRNPYNMAQPSNNSRGGGRAAKNAKETDPEIGGELPNIFPAYFTGPYGAMDTIKQLFKYKISTLVCGGGGPHAAKAIIKKFLDYRKTVACHCGCQPSLSKLYFVWIIPSGNDYEWFTDYLSELCEDEHLHHYLHIRVFLTNLDSAPDELASALLQLGLKTAGDKVTARRPSQPQLNNLYHMTSYGVPDFMSLMDYISSHHSTLWKNKQHSISGVFTVGNLGYSINKDLLLAINKSSKPDQMCFTHHRILT